LLAKTLATRAQDFWPPIYQKHGVQVGAYVVQFTLSAPHDQTRDILRTDLVASTKVIPIDSEVLERRLALHGPNNKRRDPDEVSEQESMVETRV